MISPTQLRMARAALHMTTRALGEQLDISAMAISRYERGDEGVVSVATIRRAEDWFKDRGVYFGPKDGVCVEQDVFAAARWFHVALFRLLHEAGIMPCSSALIAAHARATQNDPVTSPHENEDETHE